MSDEKKYPKFVLRMREGATGLMTGGNTELLMDGKKLGTVTKVKIEVGAREIAKLSLEMFGQFEVSGNFDPEQVEVVNRLIPEKKMIKVKSEVRTYVERYSSQEEETVTVESHGNIDSLVGLSIGGRVVYVDARELEAAIKNATNTVRF